MKINNLPLISLCLFIFSLNVAFAQPSNKFVSGSVVAAPNAAALGKYGDIPVSYHTGVPSIGVPIYTVQEGNISLPISLNYHASGIKVAEMASWVGMGWSLNAGGVITRTVQGIPDETFPMGYYNNGNLTPAENSPGFAAYMNDCSLGFSDSEPDLFAFNVAGLSGKFYVDHKDANSQGKPSYQFIPRQDLKLEFNSNFTKFTIITTDGTRYTFGQAVVGGTTVNAREYTKEFNQPASKKYCSSWYLLLVESADANFSISLNYVDEYYAYKNPTPCSYVAAMQACVYPFTNASPTNSEDCSGASIDPNHFYFTTEIEGKRLNTITSSTSTVNFIATNNRTDLDEHNQFVFNAKSLEKIQISTGTPVISCKEFFFEYDYYSDPAKATETYGKRLRLKKLQEKSCDNSIALQKYEFNYNGSFLPYRLSKATDHWGYYNGVAANDNLKVSVPSTTIPYLWSNNQSVTYGSANKESNETEMKKGVLTDITYPTGGKTSFTFEGNNVYTDLIQTPVTKLTLQACLNTPANCCGSITNTSTSISFTQPELNGNATKFKIQLWPIATNNGGQSTPCNTVTSVSGLVQAFRSSDNAVVGNPYSFNINANLSTDFLEQNLSLLQGSLNFVAGTNYYFKITTVNAYGTLTITSTPIVSQNRIVGGLRIKEIRSSVSTTQSANDVIKSYEYLQPSSTLSSGILYRKPFYGYAITGFMQGSTGALQQMNRIFFQENTVVPLFNFDGSHYGYGEVKELHNGNGYKIYKYILGNVTNNPNFSYGANYPIPPVQADLFQGQKLKEQTYSSTNALIAESSQSGSETGIQVNAKLVYKTVSYPYYCIELGPSGPITTSFTLIGRASYLLRSAVYHVTEQITMLDGVRDTVTMSYDPTSRFVSYPTSIQKRNSDNKITRLEMKYPHDMPSNCFRTFLLDRNIIGTPWQVIEKVNNLQVRGTETVYAAFTSASGSLSSTTSCGVGTFVRPYQFKSYEMTWSGGSPTTGVWPIKATIDSYNAKGLPTSMTEINWLPQTFSWTNNGLISTKSYNGYTTEYTYHPGTTLLSKIKAADGQESWYDYDMFMRPLKVSHRPSTANNKSTAKVITDLEYRHWNQITPSYMGENYQKNTTTFAAAPVGAGIGTSGLVSTETKQYSDGLGRPYQTVNRKQSPAQMDVVNAVEYDKWGRVVKSYNPIEATTNTGNLLSPIPVGTPFTLSDYYMDPLSRIKSVTPPNWYATNYTYGANTTNEVLANHTVNSYFPANSLSKSTITDPDNKIAHIYSDKKGRTILAKNTDVANSGTTNSYYFYDDKDRTIKMMPPGSTFSSSTLNFDYTYDGADNLLSKKIPDAAIVNMKYNTRNQIALFQDGNLNAQSKWQCVQYDDFGRTIKSGLINNSSVPTSITPTLAPTDLYTEIQYGSTGIQTGKVTKSKERIFGTTDWLETNFTFDIYGRVVGSTGNNHLLVTDLNAETMTVNYDFANNVLSDTRVSKKTSVSSNIITQKHDYDHWGRNKLNTNKIGTAAEHTISQINYNWKNEVIEKNIGKSATATNYLQSLDYAYNNQGWLTTINAPTLGGTNTGFPACPTAQGVPNPGVASSTLDNNDLFHFELKYDVLQTGWTGSGPKNGNIGQVIWRVRGRERQMYTLSYDYLNRLTNASYNNLSDANSTNNVGAWNEAAVYDIRGNITSLTRSGKYKTSGAATCWTDGQIDNLAYTYSANTNRLSKIVDNAPAASKAQGWNNTTNAASTAQYTFDVNGNMINDPYKGVSIQYNFLNLPSKFTWTNVSTGAERVIDILYDGRGNKLRKTVTDAGVLQYRQDYVGGIEYRTTSTVTLSLESIYHAEGRVFNTTTGTTSEPNLRYEYAIRDHLGNTRLTFTDKNGDGKIDISISPTNPTNEVLQENHYYPFGMVMQGPWMDDVAARNMPYQYNGKELNEDFGLGLSDYGARWYDASLGRWWSVDPMAEAYAPISTYHYGMNNPIFFIDPDGMSSEVPPKNMPKEYRDREKLDIYKDEANPVRGLGQGTGPVYGGDNGASQQNCPTCPGIKKGDYIATTGEYASTDEVVVTGQHMAWRRSYMYSILGEVGGKKGSLDESQNPFIWSKKEITAVTDFEMQVAMAWATGPVAEWGIAGALARYRSLSLYASNTGGRVFWSGGKSAKMMAENYAKTWGMQTLEMTTGGRIMTKLDFILPKSISSPIWKQLSINFANGAKNVATVVHNPAGIPLNSVWRFTEYPILRSKNIEIIYPNLFK